MGEVCALGQDVAGLDGAFEGLQELTQVRGGARNTKGTMRRGQGSRTQLVLDPFMQPGEFP